MTRLLRALMAATLATALMGLSATAAHADRWWGRDASRDVDQLANEVQVFGSPRIQTMVLSAPSKPEPTGECDSYYTVQSGGMCDVHHRVLTARDVLEVTVPRDCIGDPRWVRAGVRNDRVIGGRFRADIWGRSDLGTILDPAPLSPRVHRTR
jgi:hypothetical protein